RQNSRRSACFRRLQLPACFVAAEDGSSLTQIDDDRKVIGVIPRSRLPRLVVAEAEGVYDTSRDQAVCQMGTDVNMVDGALNFLASCVNRRTQAASDGFHGVE